jgi:hypothetical protein
MLDYRNLPVKFLGQRPCLSPTDGSQQDAAGDMMSTIACSRAIGLGVRLSVLFFASNCNIIFCIQSSSKQQLQTLAYLLNSSHGWWLVASLGCNHARFWPRDNRHRLMLVSVATSLRLERSHNVNRCLRSGVVVAFVFARGRGC